MKRFLLAALLVVAVAAGVWLWRSADAIVERTIEDVGTRLLGVRVSVASVDLELIEGVGAVRGLRVANPEGFSSEPALAFGEIELALDVGSLRESPIVLDRLRVTAPEVSFEVNDAGRANLEVLRENLAKAGEVEPPASDADEAPPTRLRVEQLRIEGGRIHADARALGGEARDVSLPAIEERGVGGRAGATPTELGREVLDALFWQISKTVAANQLQGYLERKIDDAFGDAGETAKGILRSITGADAPPDASD